MPDATKQPAFLSLVYQDGTDERLFNVTADEVAWFRARQDARKPVVAPTPTPTPVPVGPTDGVIVEPGQSWADALRQAQSGRTVYLRAGATYGGSLTNPNVRLQSGVHLATWPVGGVKPTIRVPNGSVLQLFAAAGFRATGIKFVADAPSDGGVRFLNGCRDCSLVRCEVTGFTMGVTSEGSAGARNAGVTVDGCHVWGNWNASNEDSSGLFASRTDGLVLNANLFERNGWKAGDPKAKGAIRNHNAYVAGDCGPVVATANVFALGSSHGLQARSGGTITGNTFVDNPIHLSVGLVNGGGPIVEGGVTAVVRGNLFVGTRDLAGSPRGWGIEVGNARDVTIEGNTFARDGSYDPKLGNFPAAVKLDVCDLEKANPQFGKDVKAKRIVLAGNAATWPFKTVWQHPDVPSAAVTAQPAWPPADVPAARSRAAAGLAATGG